MQTGMIRRLSPVVFSLVMACAGSKGNADSPATASQPSAEAGAPGAAAATPSAAGGAPSATGAATPGPGATTQTAGAGTAAASATTAAASAAPAQKPFASSALEAQTLIQGQIDQHIKVLWKCVADYRQKKGDPHKAITVDIGIDQEGTLLGVVSPNPKKGDLDPALRECLFASLRGLPFPRSHAGVITVRQTFTDVMTQ
jgi:hypothetical protein